jgi:hypothetical protein
VFVLINARNVMKMVRLLAASSYDPAQIGRTSYVFQNSLFFIRSAVTFSVKSGLLSFNSACVTKKEPLRSYLFQKHN